jgi:hypothetical protein
MTDDDARSLADERRRLLGNLELERNQLIRNIEFCRIRDIDRPFIGDWSLKDIVGHLASWEAEVVAALRELREGKRPRLLDFDSASLDGGTMTTSNGSVISTFPACSTSFAAAACGCSRKFRW